MFSVVDGKTIDLDYLTHFFVKAIASTEILWRDTKYPKMQYYYAESELYIIRSHITGVLCYSFVKAKSPIEAADKLVKSAVNNGFSENFSKCEYCGKPYRKKKKAQRFCCIKCKDKWWNRERAADFTYLHPHCEDNFNGDW